MIWTADTIKLIGKVGAEPRFSAMTEGEMVTFPIEAKTTRCRADDQGRRHIGEGTAWFRIVVLTPRLVFEAKYLRVGEVISVSGGIERRSYTCHGAERETREIIAEEILRFQPHWFN